MTGHCGLVSLVSHLDVALSLFVSRWRDSKSLEKFVRLCKFYSLSEKVFPDYYQNAVAGF